MTINDLATEAINRCKERLAKAAKVRGCEMDELKLDEGEFDISKKMKEKRGL